MMLDAGPGHYEPPVTVRLLIAKGADVNAKVVSGPDQGIDTSNTNPAGKLQLNVLMAVAEFERGIIRERVNAGLKAAKLRGVKLGRPRSLHKKTGAVLGERRNGLGVRAIARKLQMAPSSVHKILKSTDVN